MKAFLASAYRPMFLDGDDTKQTQSLTMIDYNASETPLRKYISFQSEVVLISSLLVQDLCSKNYVMRNVPQSDYALLSPKLPQNLSSRRQGLRIMRLEDVAPLIDKGGAMDSLYASLNATKRRVEAGPHVSTPFAYKASDCFGI